MGDQAGPEPTASVRQDLRLLEAAGAHPDGASVRQLARAAGLPELTAQRLLHELARDGYLDELDDGAFALHERGPRLQPAADGPTARERLRPLLSSLRDSLSAAVYLTLYDEGEIRVLEILDSPRAPRVDLWVSFQDAGHATALGKSVLRELDEEARANYLSRHSLTDLTPRTITRREELLRQLDGAPAGPLSMDRGEYARGTTCAAVPVYSGDQVGSIGISFRSDRMYRTTEVRARLLESAQRVTRRLTLPGR
ncbi:MULTISPECIES: IclR family transcriptional regulator [Streptomyces]|uniref:IclR family transcriptional regulator n=1 Tax=Streptomyces TaxID=1883 RepID=UPI0004C527FB|nr:MULTISPECIES: IclR family transcriptional regulator C-terminal domain-containing protein [Streptomyces]MDX2918422.1 IclR family transcriptional regulator C-terminal domain-containing protein [Streptomyces sp. NE06-03C]MDX3604991.1 IclR family transcriptional regulator C-terminal domain-containing protein [Streptomyces sp. FL06-04B]MDX3735794.1 IclR family transcriptional regulator C-terminal domain-containing protein [Streptomyces sp. ID01-15D]